MEEIPVDIHVSILACLQEADLLRCSAVDKRWIVIARNDGLWLRLSQRSRLRCYSMHSVSGAVGGGD